MRNAILFSLALTGCANTITPEQAKAEFASGTDYELCRASILRTDFSQQIKATLSEEIQSRNLNCELHRQNVLIEQQNKLLEHQARQAQLQAGLQLLNMSGATAIPNANSFSQPGAIPQQGFYKREFQSGVNRTCVYSGAGGDLYKTVPAAQICPLSY